MNSTLARSESEPASMADDRDVYRPKGRAQTAAPVEAAPTEIGFEPTGVITEPTALASARAKRPTDVAIAHHDGRLDEHRRELDAHGKQLLVLTAVTAELGGKLDEIRDNSREARDQARESAAERTRRAALDAIERERRAARDVERDKRRLRTKIVLAIITAAGAAIVAAIKVFA